ncbi:MAG TPA: sugar ABC transporter permease [Clostridiales bacterium]|nr:sugar ABC transporter permease [Clostridiales bacterium]
MSIKRGKRKHKTIEYGRYGYFFIAPFFIVYAIFHLWPLINTIWMSFMEYYAKGLKVVGPNFNGFKNYVNVLFGEGELFNTFTFRTLGNTIIMWVANFIPQILLSLLLAAWFTDTRVKLRGVGFFKVSMYLPNIITAASLAVLFFSLFSINGPMTQLLRQIGLIGETYDIMDNKWATRLIISFINFWMWYGNTMIILIAGILGINPNLFEAARIDGASSSQIFRNITLPLLKPITLFVLVTSSIGGLQMFDIPSLFNVNQAGDGLPDYASNTITMYIRKLTLASKDYGRAGASSVILFLVTLCISLVFFFFLSDRKELHERVAIKKKRGMSNV